MQGFIARSSVEGLAAAMPEGLRISALLLRHLVLAKTFPGKSGS